MSILDNIAKQIYINNKAWVDNIIKFINDVLSLSDNMENGLVYLYLNNGLTIVDIANTNMTDTYNTLQIILATIGIIVERAQVLRGQKIYQAISVDCRNLFTKDKFKQLELDFQ